MSCLKISIRSFLVIGFIKILFTAPCNAQNDPKTFLQSPDAASLGIYGSTQISPYTGLPDIGFNVFSLNSGPIPIKADLKYFAGGVQPESHPGWVGQNWSLNVGGIITRKVNYGPDEECTSLNTDENITTYLYHYSNLDVGDNNWYTNAFITGYWDNSPTPFIPAMAPDEFSFTMPDGKSGSFYLNHKGVWIVKSSSPGKFKIEVETNSTQPFRLEHYYYTNYYTNIKRIIYKIIITDDTGIKYTYGNVPSALEFARSPRPGVQYTNNEDVYVNAWRLTKVESPQGEIINFIYSRKANQFYQSVTYGKANVAMTSQAIFDCGGSSGSSKIYSSQVLTSSYLSEINNANYKVVFNIEQTNELKCTYLQNAFTGYPFGDLGQFFGSDTIPHWYKLKNIEIYDWANASKQKYTFSYNDIATQRLFLKSFSAVGDNPGVDDKVYKFDYDQENLPPYNAMQVDRWGYYNGRTFPNDPVSLTDEQISFYYEPSFYYTRAGTLNKITYPTGGYTTLEYELNDYSKKIVKDISGISLAAENGQGEGLRIKKITDYDNIGGIYSKSYDYLNDDGTSSGIYGGNKIIQLKYLIGSPLKAAGSQNINNTFLDLNYTNGREITYSQVKETSQDASLTIYKFSNSDNINYRDELPVNIYTNNVARRRYPAPATQVISVSANTHPKIGHISRELERGQLLSKEIRLANGKSVYKLENEYRDDAERFNEFVRYYENYGIGVSCENGEMADNYYQAMKMYTYFPYLKKQTETSYSSETNSYLSTVKTFKYDNNYRLIKEEGLYNSKNDLLKTTSKYAFDLLPSSDGVLESMISKNIFSPIIETTKFKNALQISLTRSKYYVPSSGVYVPQRISQQLLITNPLEDKIQYTHDIVGNITSETSVGGPTKSYKWGYFNAYPVAEVSNAAPNEFYFENFEYIGQGGLAHTGTRSRPFNTYTINWIRPNNREYLISYWYWTFAEKWKLKEAQLYTSDSFNLTGADAYDDIRILPRDATMKNYTYEPVSGNLTSKIDEKGQTTYFEYDKLNRLINIRDLNGQIIKHMDYHYQVQ